jgi:hypothetical protein
VRTSARRVAALALALSAALACIAGAAGASPPRPTEIRVSGGSDTWHADNSFWILWTRPPSGTPQLVSTAYRVRDSRGNPVREGRVGWVRDEITLTVPETPDSYTAEVWFEDSTGGRGPAAVTQLRFDDVRPATVEPRPVPAWIGRTALPLRIGLDHPDQPAPLSGIRGYAVAIDATPGRAPCVAADRCTEAETTLRGGIDDDELEVIALPEGTSYLHAAAVSGSGMKSAASADAILRVDTTDPLTHLHGAARGWTNRAVRLTASAIDAGSGMEPSEYGPVPFTAIRVDDGAPTIASGRTATAGVVAEGTHRIAYYARDAAGNVNDGTAGNGIVNHAPGTAWVRIDRTPPSVAFTNSQDPADPDLVRARVGDALSGPDLWRGSIGVRLAGSGDPFATLPSAPSGKGELRARWSSDTQPSGEYEFRAIGYDAAGNYTVATQRGNGTPMVLSSPLKATTALRGAFLRGGPSRIVPYGRRLLLHGRLTTGLNSPLGDAPVRIIERFAAGARPPTRVTTVKTEPGGAFSVRTASGPSRTIALAFEGSPTLSRSSAETLDLRVRSQVRLRASAGSARVGGAPLVLSGQVVAPYGAIPRGGKSVQLQFRLPGLPWSEFRTVETDLRGRFRLAYRFSDDDSRGARFRFRAYAPAQEGWPYEPAGSQPVLVRGR